MKRRWLVGPGDVENRAHAGLEGGRAHAFRQSRHRPRLPTGLEGWRVWSAPLGGLEKENPNKKSSPAVTKGWCSSSHPVSGCDRGTPTTSMDRTPAPRLVTAGWKRRSFAPTEGSGLSGPLTLHPGHFKQGEPQKKSKYFSHPPG